MSLRFRLTLLYSLLFAALLALFGVIVYLRMSSRLYSSVDDSLRVRAQQITSEQIPSTDTHLGAHPAAPTESIAARTHEPAGIIWRLET